MTTDTKPSEAATKLAAEVLVGKERCPICLWPLAADRTKGCVIGDCSQRGAGESERAKARQRLHEAALLIDAGVREMREAGEKLHVVMIQRNMTEDEREVATDMWNALRAWRTKP